MATCRWCGADNRLEPVTSFAMRLHMFVRTGTIVGTFVSNKKSVGWETARFELIEASFLCGRCYSDAETREMIQFHPEFVAKMRAAGIFFASRIMEPDVEQVAFPPVEKWITGLLNVWMQVPYKQRAAGVMKCVKGYREPDFEEMVLEAWRQRHGAV